MEDMLKKAKELGYEYLGFSEHNPSLSKHTKEQTTKLLLKRKGKIEILLDGRWQALAKGEGLYFNANQPHGYRNCSSKTATFHDIIHYR